MRDSSLKQKVLDATNNVKEALKRFAYVQGVFLRIQVTEETELEDYINSVKSLPSQRAEDGRRHRT
jgi:hypothetical protein